MGFLDKGSLLVICMGDSNALRLEQRQWEALEEMTENGDAPNRSEAARQVVAVGLDELGYGHSETPSRFASAGYLVGWACGFVALAWLGVTIAYPVELRMPAVAALFASLTAFGVSHVAGGSVRHQLGGLVGRGGDRA